MAWGGRRSVVVVVADDADDMDLVRGLVCGVWCVVCGVWGWTDKEDR